MLIQEVESNSSKEVLYETFLKALNELIDPENQPVTSMANFTALLKQLFVDVSWCGFYLMDDQELYLGPFQGKVACTVIKLGKGICGKAAELQKTIFVENVHEFKGHIACDSESNSEIVVPIFYSGELFGILDLDSKKFSNFDEQDADYLEEACSLLSLKMFTNFMP